jgi:NAD(P)-dependent dehydrogenase (short-subunit alcohol dehydrogenase family)
MGHAASAAVARFGGLDILVNNAGVGIFVTVAEMTSEQWADTVDTNLTGVFNACRAALPHLSDVLMQEVRYDNIRVSSVMPGSVATGFSGQLQDGADWKIAPSDVAEIVVDLLRMDARTLPSRVEMRPSRPRK